MGGRRPLWAYGFVICLLLAAAGCRSTPAGIVTPVIPTPGRTPIPVETYVPPPVSGAIGPVPAQCTPVPPPSTLSFPNGVPSSFVTYNGPTTFDGSSPVWLYDPQVPRIVHGNPDRTPYLPTLTWQFIAGPNYRGIVVIQGKNLQTGAPIWFNPTGEFTPGKPYVTPVVVDLQTYAPQWADFPVFPFLPQAGCYALDASWTAWSGGPAGHWQLTFAFGQ